MKRARLSSFNLISLCLIGLFFLATAWLWRGYWRTEKINKIVQKEVNEPVTNPTTTSPLVATVSSTPAVVISTSTKPTSTVKTAPRTTREAVSPLTGALALDDNDVNLVVPYTSQAPERNWEQPWQDACEEAAVLMLDAYYKGYGLSPLSAKDELQRMIDWEEKEKGWGRSIEMEKIRLLFTEYLGYKRNVRIVENPTVEQIKKFIDAGTPVLVVADGKNLPNPYYSNGGPEYHVYIIRGYTDDKFITNDPGVNRGANFVFPIKAVMDTMHDWNNGDVLNGRKVILVVE